MAPLVEAFGAGAEQLADPVQSVTPAWRNVRHELDRMHLITMQTAEGRVAQRSATTPAQAQILRSLDVAEPGRYLDFELPAPPA